MKKIWVLICLLTMVACGGGDEPLQVESSLVPKEISPTPTEIPILTPTQAVPGAQITPVLEVPQPIAFEGSPLPNERGEFFSSSGACAVCHKNHLDEAGKDISIDTFWRGTMMANSARDPYWQASVRAETLANPALDSVIQDTCSTCHTPMARTTHKFAGAEGMVLDEGFLNPENELHTLGIDGTSCTLCHQIDADHLGNKESFDGAFRINTELPTGQRVNHGPYPVGQNLVQIMQSTSGFIPQQGLHLQTSEMCATCHTLYTPIIDDEGEVVGHFPEQMPYLEWLASDYADQQSCQDCHMPVAKGSVVLSVTGGPARSPFSQHSFVGGNTYALSLLRNFGEEIGVTASSAQIEAALRRATEQLQKETAQIKLEDVEIVDSKLRASVKVSHQVGHKFPSGYPSRRVWIHLTVYDASGNVIFDSGNWRSDGAIVGNDNDSDAALYEPHYQIIENGEQVQVYEAIMGDANGGVTTTLLSGFAYLKDNRLIPVGFDRALVEEDIAVLGNAAEDLDFQGGSDTVMYEIALTDTTRSYTVTVELLYQSIGYRWAQNLSTYNAPEPDRFLNYFSEVPNLPIVVASDLVEVVR